MPVTKSLRGNYPADVEVLDCTVRDGGLVCRHQFSDDFVRGVYETCVASGIAAMECGYFNSPEVFPLSQFGVWMHCREEDVRRIVGENRTPLKLSVMIDCGGKSRWQQDLLPKSQSVIDICRVAFYDHQIAEAEEVIAHAHALGYDVWANLMAASTIDEKTLDEVLTRLVSTSASVIVVVDSFGAMLPHQIIWLVAKYRRAVVAIDETKRVGIHTHNNQQLAFANSLAAIEAGARCVDASLLGLGRGAGNCPLEILLGHLDEGRSEGTHYQLRAIYAALENWLLPLRQRIDWGPFPEYILTGQLNLHPQSAIKFRENIATRDHYSEFYEQIVNVDK